MLMHIFNDKPNIPTKNTTQHENEQQACHNRFRLNTRTVIQSVKHLYHTPCDHGVIPLRTRTLHGNVNLHCPVRCIHALLQPARLTCSLVELTSAKQPPALPYPILHLHTIQYCTTKTEHVDIITNRVNTLIRKHYFTLYFLQYICPHTKM
jgi:hypothetical protein